MKNEKKGKEIGFTVDSLCANKKQKKNDRNGMK